MRCFLGMTFLAVSFCGMAAEPETPIDIGGRKQLFLDGRMIRSSENAQVRFHEPYQSGDLLVWADQPWESGPGAYVCGGCSVLKEDGKVRLWYDVVLGEERPGIDSERGLAYAESTDGIHFTKPILGLCEHRGSTENNLVIPSYIAGGSVWIDPNDPANPYKSQTFNRAMQLVLFQSPDGLHWSEARRWDVGHCDTQSIVFWDEALGRYVLYTRRWVGGATPGAEYRIVRRLESDDLEAWGDETGVMQADARDLAIYRTVTGQPPMDYYGAAVFRYPDADGLYLMLTQPFWHWRQYPPSQQWGDTGDPQLAQYERLGPSTLDTRLREPRRHVQHAGERLLSAPARGQLLSRCASCSESVAWRRVLLDGRSPGFAIRREAFQGHRPGDSAPGRFCLLGGGVRRRRGGYAVDAVFGGPSGGESGLGRRGACPGGVAGRPGPADSRLHPRRSDAVMGQFGADARDLGRPKRGQARCGAAGGTADQHSLCASRLPSLRVSVCGGGARQGQSTGDRTQPVEYRC